MNLGSGGKQFQHARLSLGELPEDSMCATSTDFGVKNTFIDIDGSLPCSPSLAPFYRERQVRSCPSAQIGRLQQCFADLASDSTRTPQVSPKAAAVPAAAMAAATPTADAEPHTYMVPSSPCYQESSAPAMARYEYSPIVDRPAMMARMYEHVSMIDHGVVMAPMRYQYVAWGTGYGSSAPEFGGASGYQSAAPLAYERAAPFRKTVVCLSAALPGGQSRGELEVVGDRGLAAVPMPEVPSYHEGAAAPRCLAAVPPPPLELARVRPNFRALAPPATAPVSAGPAPSSTPRAARSARRAGSATPASQMSASVAEKRRRRRSTKREARGRLTRQLAIESLARKHFESAGQAVGDSM